MMGERKGLPVGTRLGDGNRYEIRQRIGQGAMAEVYQAIDRRLNGRVVAVKTLSATVADHPFSGRMRTLFIEEARALSRVKDDNVVAVLDSGTTPDDTPFMVMEFLLGRDLAGLLKEQKQLSIERTVDIMLAVCAGVHACHLAGIIHRDLKPANIFLDQTPKGEQPKVLDFSVAKMPISADQTHTDLIVGTASYMSPEQALGRPADERSDQYSIGALLYRCLTGRPPEGLVAKSREIRPDVPEAIEAILLRAMNPIPENRFSSVHDLGQSLLPFASSFGHGRWKPYYTALPVAVRATLSEPMEALDPGPVASDVEMSATTVAAYDFDVHERTTNTAAPPPMAEAMLSSGVTADGAIGDAVSPGNDGPPTVSFVRSTTVDPKVPSPPLAPTAAAPSMTNPDVMSVAGGPASRAEPTNLRRRRSVLVASVVGAVVLVGGSAALHFGRASRLPSTTPIPPAWTRSVPPVDIQTSSSAPREPTVLHAVQESPAPVSQATELPSATSPKSPENPSTGVKNERVRTLRGPLRARADRASHVDVHRRWTGAGNKPDGSHYPAMVNPPDSKYPAMP